MEASLTCEECVSVWQPFDPALNLQSVRARLELKPKTFGVDFIKPSERCSENLRTFPS